MAPRIERHVSDTGPEIPAVTVECRSASCRLVLEHASTFRVAEHQSLMGIAQRVVQTFIETNPASFEPFVLIAAHYQEPERPYLKLFLRRAGQGQPGQRADRRSSARPSAAHGAAAQARNGASGVPMRPRRGVGR
jgi:hypothetical protein